MTKILIGPGLDYHWQATLFEGEHVHTVHLPYSLDAGAALVQRDVERQYPNTPVWIYRWADCRPAIA